MTEKTTKDVKTKKILTNVGEIYIKTKDLNNGIKEKTKLYKFVHEEVDYYTEDQLKFLYTMYNQKLEAAMKNIFTFENPSMRKQVIYTMVCKDIGEGKVYHLFEKFNHEDKDIVEGLLCFIKNEIEEITENLKNFDHKLKIEEIKQEEFDEETKKLKENLNILENALEKPEDSELKEEYLERIKSSYEYFEKILREKYEKDVVDKKDFKKSLKFYQEALENNESKIEYSEKKEFS